MLCCLPGLNGWPRLARCQHLSNRCPPITNISSEKAVVSQERVSGFPETEADLQGSAGNFWGSLGNFRGNLWIAVTFHSERTSGEVAKKPLRKFGELPGKSGDFPEARGSLTPSQRLAKFVSSFLQDQILKFFVGTGPKGVTFSGGGGGASRHDPNRHNLSGPISRDIAILSLRYPILRDTF